MRKILAFSIAIMSWPTLAQAGSITWDKAKVLLVLVGGKIQVKNLNNPPGKDLTPFVSSSMQRPIIRDGHFILGKIGIDESMRATMLKAKFMDDGKAQKYLDLDGTEDHKIYANGMKKECAGAKKQELDELVQAICAAAP